MTQAKSQLMNYDSLNIYLLHMQQIVKYKHILPITGTMIKYMQHIQTELILEIKIVQKQKY